MKSEQELDRLVQQHLLNTDTSAGDWDMPSDDVWENVRGRIQEQDRRRGLLWWLFFGAILLPVVVMLFMQAQKATGQKPEDNQNPQSASTEINVASAVPDALNSPDPAAQFTEASLISKSELKITAGSEASDQKTTGHLKPRPKHTTSTEAVNPHISVSAPVTPSNDNTPYSQSSDAASAGKDHTVQDNVYLNLMPTARPTQSIAFLSPLTIVPFTATQLLPYPDPVLIISRSAPRHWSLTAALAPSMSSRRIIVPDAQPRVRRALLLQQEDPAAQLGFSVSAIREIGSHWSLGFGIEYSRFLLNSSYTHQIRYTRAGEMLNTRGNFENRFNLNLNTSYGELSTDVILERSSDAQIEEHQFIALSLQTRQSMQVLQFPVSARYEIPFGRVLMSMQAGISANFLLENTLEFRAIQSMDTDIVQTRAIRQAHVLDSRDFALGYHFGVGIEIPVDRRLSILMEPTFSGYLQPVYRNRQVVIYPLLMDVHLGVRYRL